MANNKPVELEDVRDTQEELEVSNVDEIQSKTVKALVNIKHDGIVYLVNDEFKVYESIAKDLEEKGYVEVVGE